MVVHVVNGDTELSHLTIEPVCPLNVSNPLVELEQMVVPPLTLPATVVGLTITIVESAFAVPHEPL